MKALIEQCQLQSHYSREDTTLATQSAFSGLQLNSCFFCGVLRLFEYLLQSNSHVDRAACVSHQNHPPPNRRKYELSASTSPIKTTVSSTTERIVLRLLPWDLLKREQRVCQSADDEVHRAKGPKAHKLLRSITRKWKTVLIYRALSMSFREFSSSQINSQTTQFTFLCCFKTISFANNCSKFNKNVIATKCTAEKMTLRYTTISG